MSLEYKGELNIESLIEAPLIAAVKANSLMQREQVRFLLDTCFSAYDVNDVCDFVYGLILLFFYVIMFGGIMRLTAKEYKEL